MDDQFGPAYSRAWATYTVMAELGERTVDEALVQGEDAKVVWRAVVEHLELPKSER